jgi:thiosulfate dehydrogenase
VRAQSLVKAPNSLGIALALAATGALSSSCAKDSAAPISALERGRELTETTKASSASSNAFTCLTCHRRSENERTGQLLPGAVLAGSTERPSYWNGRELSLLAAVNHCRFFFMGSRKDWTQTDDEAKALYASLLDLSANASPAQKGAQAFTIVAEIGDLPGAGDAVRGGEIYRNACATCHGKQTTGAGRISERAVRLPEETDQAHAYLGSKLATRVVFIEKIRHGVFLGYSGVMPPFSTEVLSDAQLRDVLTFLRQY